MNYIPYITFHDQSIIELYRVNLAHKHIFESCVFYSNKVSMIAVFIVIHHKNKIHMNSFELHPRYYHTLDFGKLFTPVDPKFLLIKISMCLSECENWPYSMTT